MENDASNPKLADQGAQGQNEQGNEPKTFTQEELNEIVSKRINEKSAKDQAKFEKQLADAQKEWERKAKLSDEERAAEAQKAKISELEQRERDITMRERKAEALAKLAEKDIPQEFVGYIVDVDAEKMETNIERLAKVWNAALERGVKAKLAGKTPDDVGGTPQGTPAAYKQTGGVSSF